MKALHVPKASKFTLSLWIAYNTLEKCSSTPISPIIVGHNIFLERTLISTDTYNNVWKDFSAYLVEILMLSSPTDFMLTSFEFCFINLKNIRWNSSKRIVLFLKSWMRLYLQTQLVTLQLAVGPPSLFTNTSTTLFSVTDSHFTHETEGPWLLHFKSTPIGGKGEAVPSSLCTPLERPTEWVNARWM